MESGFNELMNEFQQQWDNEEVDFAAMLVPLFRMDDFIRRAYEIGKRTNETNRKKEIWKPIETAPKNGKEILVRNNNQGGCLRLIRFNAIHNYWQCKGDPILSLQDTHWMKIPDFKEPMR